MPQLHFGRVSSRNGIESLQPVQKQNDDTLSKTNDSSDGPELAASVIITTYNSVRALGLVLDGYSAQDRTDFELIVADDGSSDETATLIEQRRSSLPFRLVHVWQADDGFQKCRILNKAILASSADYLIISDGDCIPRNDFVSTHINFREPGRYLSGGLFRLNQTVTDKVTSEDIFNGNVFDFAWLKSSGQKNKWRKKLKLTKSQFKAKILEMLSPAPGSWNGANSSCWKADAIKVNGFDERLRYGALDREFGLRLVNLGRQPKKVRYSACAVHLEHGRGYNTKTGWEFNRAVRKKVEKEKIVRAELGLDQHVK